LERFQAKAGPGLDPGWIPVRAKKTRRKQESRPWLIIEEISGGCEAIGTLSFAVAFGFFGRSQRPAQMEKPMTVSLYDLSVPTFLQTTRAAGSVLDRAVRHCAEIGTDPDDFVEARLFEDMAPFHFQIESLKNHAVWGLEAAKTGVFAPPPLVGAVPFADLQAMVGRAVTALEALTPDEVNSWSDKNLDIELFRPLDQKHASTSKWGPRTLALTPETYLLTYSLPNFYFHVVTAYNILRTRGVPIGKGDYEGQLRIRPT
jgi:uncharacterized protein